MDSSQFKLQILTMSDKLFRLAKSILRSDDDAKDALQELNLKLWERKDQLDIVENFPAFAMRSMRNLCVDSIRITKDKTEITPDLIYDEPSPHLQIENSDMVSRIRFIIDRLPELQRTIIRMRDVEGLEISEIAYITNLTPNAVTVNLSRARQRIRDLILNEQKRVEQQVWKA
jgi:RNA polymerase sigma-70 factor (ECF subfamily)